MSKIFSDVRVSRATTSFFEESRPHGLFLAMQRYQVVRDWSISLLSPSRLHLFRQISAHVDWKTCTKEGYPTVSLWMAGVSTNCPEQNDHSHIQTQSLFLVSHTHTDKNTNHTNSVLFSTRFLLVNAACAMIYPLEEPKLKNKIC